MSDGIKTFGQAIFVVGLQYGDEGKGKIVDLLTADVAAVARGNGGSNAGHTIVLADGQVIALHQLPSGISCDDTSNVIGHGVLVDPVRLVNEIKDVRGKGIQVSPSNLMISDMAHLVLPKHKIQDAHRESTSKAQGSTKAGIAYAASDKSLRVGIRVDVIRTFTKDALRQIALDGLDSQDAGQLAQEFAEAAHELKPYIQDTPAALNLILDNGGDVLIEGAQAYGLDINHGKYPYTTSCGTTVPALIEGTGVNPKRAGRTIGVIKAVPSKVGGGTFVSKIEDSAMAETVRGKKVKSMVNTVPLQDDNAKLVTSTLSSSNGQSK